MGSVFVTFLLIVETCPAAVSTHSQDLSTYLSALDEFPTVLSRVGNGEMSFTLFILHTLWLPSLQEKRHDLTESVKTLLEDYNKMVSFELWAWKS